MEIADRENQWFKFKLHYEGGTYKPLDHTIHTRQKFIRRSLEGNVIESRVTTREIPLNYRVESHFRGEFICEPNFLFQGSDVERCFSSFLYPPPSSDGSPVPEDAQGFYDSNYDEIWEYLQGRDPYE